MIGNKEIMSRNIRRMMEAKGVKNIDVCNAIDVPTSTFSGWLHGAAYPRINKIERMANYFGCTKGDLIEDEYSVVNQYEMTNKEYQLLCGYRDADAETKTMIDRLLLYVETERRWTRNSNSGNDEN